MNWIKLRDDFHAFSAQLGLKVNEDETNYSYGKATIHRVVEHGRVFYELKHIKPVSDYGSKMRIYSKSSGNVYIKARSRLFRKPIIRTNIALSADNEERLIALCQLIGRYQWTTEPHHKGWPFELKSALTLKFECKHIDFAVSALPEIRRVHYQLLEERALTK